MRLILLVALALFLSTGCANSDKPRPYPVSGQVLYKNKPLADALVTFHPKPGQPLTHPLSATTGPDGRFKLTYLTANDGAPAGEYAVTVVLREKRRDGDEEVRNGRNLLAARFENPETSKLTATVTAGENTLQPFVVE